MTPLLDTNFVFLENNSKYFANMKRMPVPTSCWQLIGIDCNKSYLNVSRVGMGYLTSFAIILNQLFSSRMKLLNTNKIIIS